MAPTLNIVGYQECQYSQRALQAADVLDHADVAGTINRQIFKERAQYLQWLEDSRSNTTFVNLGQEAQIHATSPIVFSEDEYIGGCTEFETLAASLLDVNTELSGATSTKGSVDYDSSLGRFQELVKGHKFTIWLFWRGLW